MSARGVRITRLALGAALAVLLLFLALVDPPWTLEAGPGFSAVRGEGAPVSQERPTDQGPPTTTRVASGRSSSARARTATSSPFNGWIRPTNNSTGPSPRPVAALAPP